MSNHNNSWPYSSPQRPQPDGQPPPTVVNGRVVENGHRLLAVYPPASATPVHHVATHMGNVRTSSAPTFPMANYSGSYPSLQSQAPYNGNPPHGNPPPPYSEYDSRLQYLAQPQGPSLNDSGFWENTRNDAVRMLNEHAGPSYPYRDATPAPPSSQWIPPSSYQTNPFAQTVFQRTTPSSAYPTPPPPGISASSSSLAYALGAPPAVSRSQPHPQTPRHEQVAAQGSPAHMQQQHQHGQGLSQGIPQQMRQQPQAQRIYRSHEAHAYYEDFLDKKTKQMNEQQRQHYPQHQPQSLHQPQTQYSLPPRASNYDQYSSAARNTDQPQHHHQHSNQQRPLLAPQTPVHHSSLPPKPGYTQTPTPSPPGVYAQPPHDQSVQSQQHSRQHQPQAITHTNGQMRGLPQRPPSVSFQQHDSYHVHAQPPQGQANSALVRPPSIQQNYQHPSSQPLSRQSSLQKPPSNSLSYPNPPSISKASSSSSIFPPIKRPITPPSKASAPDSSPDPLALRSGGDGAPDSIPIPVSSIKLSAQQNKLDMGTVTPRKRKPVVEILTPSKRMHLMKSGSSSSIGSIGSNEQFAQSLSQNSIPPKTPVRSSVPVTPSTSHSQLSQSAPGAPNSMRSASSAASIPSSEGSVPATPFFKRIKNNAYVSITPRAHLTPKTPGSSKRMKLDSDDLGGYGDDDGYGDEDAEGEDYEDSMAGSPVKRARGVHDSAVKGSARRTGDRDSRNPLEKLISLIEDIFEAEDTLPPGSEAESMEELKNHDFFSPQSRDPSRPMLNAAIVRKLTKYMGYVARPGKRGNLGGGATNGVNGATPRTVGAKGKGRMGDVDTQILGRLLKILERGVKAGEDLEGFPSLPSGAGAENKSPTKRGAKKGGKSAKKDKENERRSRSRTPKDDHDDAMDEDQPSGSGAVPNGRSKTPTEEDHEKLAAMLELAKDSILSAECVIAVLGSDRLPKQLYSEELIIACLATIKNQLTKILYPFVEASSSISSSSSSDNASLNTLSPLLLSVLKSSNSPHRPLIQGLYQALSATLPRITGLVNSENVAMSDTIIISGVYIAIGPFFIADGGDSGGAGKKDKEAGVVVKTLGKSAMRALRLDALSLIRSIFANHENQRSWIIEEILTSLIKLNDTKQKAGQFRLRDGRSIRTVSALLLQLVQTSAHDVRIAARKIERARQNKFALKRQESMSEIQGGKPVEEPFLDENDHDELKLYTLSLESASKAAKTIIVFLTQRSGKGKATKNSNEAEYRAILDNLIEDLLVVLFWPEWPAAGLILGIMMRFMVTSLDDVKANSQTDSNAAKQMALEHLGVIAAKIRTSKLKFQKEADAGGSKPLKALDDIVSSVSVKSLNRFLEVHRGVASHLCKQSSEDQAYESARELTAAMYGHELSSALKTVHKAIENPEDDDDLDIKDTKKLHDFGTKLKIALREVWKDPSTDVFNVGSQEEAQRIDDLSEELGTIQSLRNSFNPILNVVLGALDAPAIFMRTKALKALGQMVTSDSSILSASNVRRGIESHLLDSSPQVRDAAVELIGKYMIDTPEVAGDYYSKIADRMADTGLGVRKRVIKLLKSFYSVSEDTTRKMDIATRLVLRMLDEDETVKDLAIKSIEELWFPPMPLPSALKSRSQTANANNPHDKSALLAKVSIIMGTAANFKDRQSPLEDVLHKIMNDKEGTERNSLHARYGEICEALIDGLVDASDLPGFTVANCVRTIHLLTSAYPSVLSATNASTLLPYLKNPSSPEELMASDYLLKIFRVSVPHLPKTAAKFGQELQTALQPMIIKPSSAGGVQILQETVSCMCIVVQHLTHDFVRLINLLKSCNARLQQMVKRKPGEPLNPTELRTSVVLIFIVSLLAENCKFDHLRKEHPELATDLNSISQGSIIEHVYLTLLTLYEKFDNTTLRARVLQCLGFLFRAQPTLMTMERSALIMDQIFTSTDEEAKGRLLRIIQEFLISESEKHNALEKESTKGKGKAANINMEELVGNTDGFADSGVSSAIVQRYLDHVLEAALSPNPQIQAVAIDVLSFTIKQGLAHPLQSFPVIVALETSTVVAISSRASALHAILHGKHSSLLNARYMASARMTFDYQKKIAAGPVQGFRMQPTPTALLQRWYSHIREKRTTRQDFLKALVKVFQESESFESSQDDVNYTRYMAENFASFDYKTQEEVFTVIKFLTNILSTTGMQLLEVISPSHLLTHLHGSSQGHPIPQTSTNEVPTDAMDVVSVPQPEKPNVKQLDRPALMRTSVIIAMVMLLKAHLKALYSLSEEKCLKFVVGKKTAIGDKPVTKRNDNPISWARLSFATTPLLTTEDADSQKARFLEIWNEDGATAEPEDEEFL